MSWLLEYCSTAGQSDQLVGNPDHQALLLTGLVGEAGGILVEFKKRAREGAAYPQDQARLCEELGDLLWYFVRVVQMSMPSLIKALNETQVSGRVSPQLATHFPMQLVANDEMHKAISLSTAASSLLKGDRGTGNARALMAVWDALLDIATVADMSMRDVARRNVEKRESRWPTERRYAPYFDAMFQEEEQLPRRLDVEFHELGTPERPLVVLRCDGQNVGDRLTDNIRVADDYRFHDVFHFAHMAYLGWSPVLRAVLRCKRKSDRNIDENEDGARAAIIEEAVSVTVFNRAKEVGLFRNIDHVDYDILKVVEGLVQGFEVDRTPLWQWEEAILGGYEVFRQMKDHQGGRLSVDMMEHRLNYSRL